MASSIRWRKSDEERLKREIKNFNAKISRLDQKSAYENLLPEKMRYKDLRKEINSRKEFNNLIKSLKRFTKKGSEEIIENRRGVQFTKYEINEARIKARRVNYKIRRLRSEAMINPKISLAEIEDAFPKEKKVNIESARSRKEWNKYVQTLSNQSKPNYFDQRNRRYKENYIKSLYDNFSIENKRIKNTVEKIIQFIKNIDDNEFANARLNSFYLQISYNYDAPLNDQIEMLNSIYDAWRSYV